MFELPLHHIAIAVPSIDAALPHYEQLTGAVAGHRERVDAQGVEVCFVGSGPVTIELLEPLRPDSPVGRFLEKRGPGLHHLAYRTDDIDAELRRLSDAGVRLIDTIARPGAHGHRVAFVHPASAGGVLIELVGA